MEAEVLLKRIMEEEGSLEQVGLKEDLEEAIRYLLLHDFHRLTILLYRVDVDEDRLKLLLRQNPEKDAAVIISELLLQRMEQKKR